MAVQRTHRFRTPNLRWRFVDRKGSRRRGPIRLGSLGKFRWLLRMRFDRLIWIIAQDGWCMNLDGDSLGRIHSVGCTRCILRTLGP